MRYLWSEPLLACHPLACYPAALCAELLLAREFSLPAVACSCFSCSLTGAIRPLHSGAQSWSGALGAMCSGLFLASRRLVLATAGHGLPTLDLSYPALLD